MLSGLAMVVEVLVEVSEAEDGVLMLGANQDEPGVCDFIVDGAQIEVPEEVNPPTVAPSRLSFSTESMRQPATGVCNVIVKFFVSAAAKFVAGKLRTFPVNTPAGVLLT